MSVNGVTSNQAAAAYNYSATENVKADTTVKEETKVEGSSTAADSGAVYEPSKADTTAVKKTYKPDTNLINKMKADSFQKDEAGLYFVLITPPVRKCHQPQQLHHRRERRSNIRHCRRTQHLFCPADFIGI